MQGGGGGQEKQSPAQPSEHIQHRTSRPTTRCNSTVPRGHDKCAQRDAIYNPLAGHSDMVPCKIDYSCTEFYCGTRCNLTQEVALWRQGVQLLLLLFGPYFPLCRLSLPRSGISRTSGRPRFKLSLVPRPTRDLLQVTIDGFAEIVRVEPPLLVDDGSVYADKDGGARSQSVRAPHRLYERAVRVAWEVVRENNLRRERWFIKHGTSGRRKGCIRSLEGRNG